jgi:hypothetical protein
MCEHVNLRGHVVCWTRNYHALRESTFGVCFAIYLFAAEYIYHTFIMYTCSVLRKKQLFSV